MGLGHGLSCGISSSPESRVQTTLGTTVQDQDGSVKTWEMGKHWHGSTIVLGNVCHHLQGLTEVVSHNVGLTLQVR